MLRFTKNDTSAELQSKADFKFYCIVTDLHVSDLHDRELSLESCHLFPRSTFPEISNCVENRFPINTRDHRDSRTDCLDYVAFTSITGSRSIIVRKPLGRLEWLLANTHAFYKERLLNRLETLFQGILEECHDKRLLCLIPDMRAILIDRKMQNM